MLHRTSMHVLRRLALRPARVLPLIAALALVFLLAAPALAANRYALVIGNDDYEALPDLRKAVNDANAVGDALETIGFTVIRGENLTQRQMQDRLFDLTGRLAPGDTAFVFFAGHGVALGGGNLLLPVDAPVPQGAQAEDRVRLAGLAEADLIAQVRRAGAQLAVVVIDACRNNPFAEVGTRTVGFSRGLTRPPETRGVFSIYSAGFGQTALDRLGEDDPHPNSVFTRAFVPALTRPGTSLVRVAYDVNEEVELLAKTIGHEQSPAYYDQARALDIYLAGPPGAERPSAGQTTPACAKAEADYGIASRIDTPDAYRAFVEGHPACPPYSGFAKALIAKGEAAPSVATAAGPEEAPDDGGGGSHFLFDPADTDASTSVPDQAAGASQTDVAAVDQGTAAEPKPVAPVAPAGTLLRSLGGHGYAVYSVAFSADGGTLASGSEDNTIKLWRVADGALLRTLEGHRYSAVASVAFSPDGQVLAGGSWDKTITLWDLSNNGTLLRTLEGHDSAVTSVAFSPDGRMLASGSYDKTVKLWSAASGVPLRSFERHSGSVLSVAFSLDGQVLASGSDAGTISFWDVSSSKLLHTLGRHGASVYAVAFSPDGRTLASGSAEKTISLWSMGEAGALAAQ